MLSKVEKNTKLIVTILLGICVAVLTLILSLSNRGDTVIKLLSIIIALLGTTYLMLKYDWMGYYSKIDSLIKNIALIVAILSINIVRSRFVEDWKYYISKVGVATEKYQMIVYYLTLMVALVGIYTYYCLLFDYLYKIVFKEVVLTMDINEKKIVYSFVILMFFALVCIYNNTSAFSLLKYYDANGEVVSLKYDAILDCDTVVTINDIENFVYRFRHPTYFFVALPEYSIANTLSYMFYCNNQVCLAIMGCFRIVKLAIVGLCVKRMVNSKWAMVLLYTSFPFLLYAFTTERHVDMLFWLVIMVWTYYMTNRENYLPIMYSGGVTLIGVVITPVVMKVESAKGFMLKALKLASLFVFTIIVTGQLRGLLNISQDLESNSVFVNNTTVDTNWSRFTVAVKSCFGDVKIWYPTSYSTMYSEGGISTFGIVILALCLVSGILLFKNKYARICLYWVLISVILFPIVGFSPWNYSMHMIMFSWAFISLIVLLGKCIIDKINTVYATFIKALCIVFVAIQLAININTIMELIDYAARFNFID